MKVLVTGSGGFIGSHVVEALLIRGHQVKAFLHYDGQSSHGFLKELGDGFEPFWGDLTDEGSVDSAADGCEGIIHMGAMISVAHSFDAPRATINANVIGTLNVLEAAIRTKAHRVIVTSSSEVYGSADPLPIKETHPMKPQSPYAASKIAADAIAESYYRSYGMPVTILRPFNTYGPRQSDRAVIPNVIKQALWGDKIQIGTLSTLRDFVYVEDTAQGFVKALDAPFDQVVGQTIHLGTGNSYSVADVITKVLNILQRDIPIESVEYRKRPNMAEVTHLLADPTVATQKLDWSSAVSFDEGLKRTIDYIRQHPEAYDSKRYTK